MSSSEDDVMIVVTLLAADEDEPKKKKKRNFWVYPINEKRQQFGEACDQKLASDSSGLPGGFSGQRAWVRIFKKWAPGSYCLELVVACPAAGTSAQILLVEGK
jgi:hypothetical protein